MNSKGRPTVPPTASEASSHPGKRARRNLIALGSAAVLAIYAAGFLRTASAAHRLTAEERKRPAAPEGPTLRAVATAPAALPSAQPPASAVSTQSASVVPALSPAPAVPVIVPAVPVAASAPVAAATILPAPVASAPSAPKPSPAEVPVTPVASVVASPVAPSTAAPVAAQPKYKDGTFYGWGSCRHGDLQASVAIKDGRIVAAAISECHTRYSQSVIAMLPGQVVARQSPDVDAIAGATQSSDAFYYAVVEALKQAK